MSPRWTWVAASLWLAAGDVSAQRSPRLGYAFPAGGARGTSFKVVLGGQYLDGASSVHWSGDGVEAEVVRHEKPPTAKETVLAREKLQEVRQQMEIRRKSGEWKTGEGLASFLSLAAEQGYSMDDLKRFAEYRRRQNDPKRQLNPQLSETVVVAVAVAPDAAPGRRELRLRSPRGLSNPLAFEVGTLPELTARAAETNLTWEYLAGVRSTPGPGGPAERDAREVAPPVMVNGQILPGEVDRLRLPARQGQNLVAILSARELMPYLADAVPGWFQATLALLDAHGAELAFADDYRFHPDPVLQCVIPEDGNYVIEVRDAIYRGREDFVYRLTLGELPYVTSMFPLGGPAGAEQRVALRGWNLAGPEAVLHLGKAGIQSAVLDLGADAFQSVLIAADTLPECGEAEARDAGGSPRTLPLPIMVNGVIGGPGEVDRFRFEARAGAQVVAETTARRLGSPLDSLVSLVDVTGKTLAASDDHDDPAAGRLTHHADSYLRVVLPADGLYEVQVRDAQHQGGPEHGYRLRLSPPRPGFELRVVPSMVNASAGATVPLTVHAVRRDGFDGDITLELTNAPAGVALGGAWVPSGQDRIPVTLTVPGVPSDEPLRLELVGRAIIGGGEVRQPAVPSDDLMQAFFYRHLVPARQFLLSVSGRARSDVRIEVANGEPVRIPVGGAAKLRLGGPRGPAMSQMRFELVEPPPGLSLGAFTATLGQGELELHADAGKTQAGLKGNLLVNAYAERPAALPRDGSPAAALPRPSRRLLPAIPFEIVERE